MTAAADAFDELQQRLGEALHANRAGSGIDHVMIVLPSFSIGESTLAHYAARIPSLEHRYLNALLIAGRITDCHVVHLEPCARPGRRQLLRLADAGRGPRLAPVAADPGRHR